MIWRLTEEVWWGDRFSLTDAEVKGHEVGAVLNLAHNLTEHYGGPPHVYDLLSLSEEIPYFRLARRDEQEVDEVFIQNLNAILDVIERGEHHPVLIHCWEGRHRSPVTAVYAAFRRGEPTEIRFNELYGRMLELRPTFVKLEYAESLLSRLRLEFC